MVNCVLFLICTKIVLSAVTAQCIATELLDDPGFESLQFTSIFPVIFTAAWRILRHAQIVYGVRCSVYKTAMEITCRHIWENNIKTDI